MLDRQEARQLDRHDCLFILLRTIVYRRTLSAEVGGEVRRKVGEGVLWWELIDLIASKLSSWVERSR